MIIWWMVAVRAAEVPQGPPHCVDGIGVAVLCGPGRELVVPATGCSGTAGLTLSGIPVRTGPPRVSGAEVTFPLDRQADPEYWQVWLQRTQFAWLGDVRVVEVGITGCTGPSQRQLHVGATTQRWIAAWAQVVAAVVLLLGVSWLFRARLLRDPDGRTWSLSAFQLWLWTLISVFSAVYLTAFADRPLGVNASLATLTGIGVAALAIRRNGADEEPPDTASGAGPSNLIKVLPDITDDGQIHRVQYLVWTILLGAWFVVKVVRSYEMPELDLETLALMGVSATGYVAVKVSPKVAT